jgi:hypothetical protein
MSCNAPRNNPLDPENQDSKTVVITGKVTYKSKLITKPIESARVSLNNENISVLTDKNGFYQITCGKNKNSYLFFEKTGFSKDSLFIDPTNENKIILNKELDYLPVIDSIKFYSEVQHKFNYPAENYLYIEAYVSDGDSYLDSVFLQCDNLNFSTQLTRQNETKLTQTVPASSLQSTAFGDVVGKQFYLRMVTSDQRIYKLNIEGIKRVIDREIEVLYPLSDTLSSTDKIILKWTRYDPGFSYHYELEVSTLSSGSIKSVTGIIKLDSDKINYDVTSLVAGSGTDFYWYIACVDDYGNRSKSSVYHFITKN